MSGRESNGMLPRELHVEAWHPSKEVCATTMGIYSTVSLPQS